MAGTPFDVADTLAACELYGELGYPPDRVFLEERAAASLSRRGRLVSYLERPGGRKPPAPPALEHDGHCVVILLNRQFGAWSDPVVVREQFVADWEADRCRVNENPMVQCVCDIHPSVVCPVECGARGPVVCSEQQFVDDVGVRRDDDRRSISSAQSAAETVAQQQDEQCRMVHWSLMATYVDGPHGKVYDGPLISLQHVEEVYQSFCVRGPVASTSVAKHIQAEIATHLATLRAAPFPTPSTKRTGDDPRGLSPPVASWRDRRVAPLPRRTRPPPPAPMASRSPELSMDRSALPSRLRDS
jgi:hypothetical protein